MSQKLPGILIYIGEFDWTFESISPDAYVENLQNKKRLRSRSLKTRLIEHAEDTDNTGHHTTFALEARGKGGSAWAVGSISVDQHGNIRVSGRIGLGYDLTIVLFLVLFLFISMIFSVPDFQAFVFASCILFVIGIVVFAGLMSTKEVFIAHLRESRHSDDYFAG